MSEMPLERDQLRGEAANLEQLLAMPGLGRGLEPEPADEPGPEVVAEVTREAIVEIKTTIVQLVELIAAIERRLPQVERSGEAAIANAAMHLRIEATKRIVELEAEVAGRESVDPRPVTT